MSAETINTDPCMVAGTVAAARFGTRGPVVREGFEQHPKVRRWIERYARDHYSVEPRNGFDALLREAIRW